MDPNLELNSRKKNKDVENCKRQHFRMIHTGVINGTRYHVVIDEYSSEYAESQQRVVHFDRGHANFHFAAADRFRAKHVVGGGHQVEF